MSHSDRFDEPTDPLREEEYPDEDEFDDDASLTLPCPQCGADVYEDAPACPACGAYITHDTSQWSARPAWWILLGILGVLAAMLALAGLAPP